MCACNNRHLLAACVSVWESESARMLHDPAHWQQHKTVTWASTASPVACLVQRQCEQEEAGQRQGVQEILGCVTHTHMCAGAQDAQDRHHSMEACQHMQLL